jgi:hypothetical protein
MNLLCLGRRGWWCLSRSGLVLVLGLVLGCGGGEGTWSGQVLYKDKPVPGGRITFRPADGRQNSVVATLDEQGRFEATLPVGEVKVQIDNRELEPIAQGKAAPKISGIQLPPDVKLPTGGAAGQPPPHDLPGKYLKIPEKYYTIETSTLTYTITSGSKNENIVLK